MELQRSRFCPSLFMGRVNKGLIRNSLKTLNLMNNHNYCEINNNLCEYFILILLKNSHYSD